MKEAVFAALIRSFVRKGITALSSALVTKGIIDANLAGRLNTEAVTLITTGIITFLVSAWLSYRNVIIEFVKTRIGILMPPTTTLETVTQIAENVEDKRAVAKGEVKAEDITGILTARVGKP